MLPKDPPTISESSGKENKGFEDDSNRTLTSSDSVEVNNNAPSLRKNEEVIEINTVEINEDKLTDVNLNDVKSTKQVILSTESSDKKGSLGMTINTDHGGLNGMQPPPSPSASSMGGGGGGRRPSFVRRASISLDQMRRKSIDVVKVTFSSYRGIVLAMASSVFFTFTAVIVKYLKEIHPGQMACFRFLGILLFTIPMIITAGVNPLGPKEKRHLLLLRGIAGASSLYLRYSALHYLPIANATVIVLSMPVFVCIFARVFLKEPCGIFHCVSIGITLIGIGFTANIPGLFGLTPDESADRSKELIGLVYSMGATLIGASVYIFVRKVKECHNSVILFNFAMVAIVETSILTGLDNGFAIPQDPMVPWLLIILATLSFYAQLLLTKALQLEEASLVSVTRASAEVVCAFIFQIIIFHQIPTLNAFIGALLVTSSVLLTSARKWVITLPSEHIGRKLLGFTLK